MLKRRINFLLQLVYFLLFSFWVVPVSPQIFVSWPLFLRTIGLRLLVVVPFILLTRRVMESGHVDAIRISPPPESAAGEAGPNKSEIPGLAADRRKRRLSPRQIVVFDLGVCVFLANLLSGLHAAMHLPVSPHVVVGCCWAVIESVFLGIFTVVVLRALVERRIRFTRRSAIVAAVVIALVGTYIVFPKEAMEWGVRLLCLGTMLFFWMPGPGQMSANIPEELHVVPRVQPELDRPEPVS